VCHLDRVCVPQLVRRKPPADARRGGRVMQLSRPDSGHSDPLIRSSLAASIVGNYVTALLTDTTDRALWSYDQPRPSVRISGSFFETRLSEPLPPGRPPGRCRSDRIERNEWLPSLVRSGERGSRDEAPLLPPATCRGSAQEGVCVVCEAGSAPQASDQRR
jgi:hypothetical protein